MNVVKGFSKIVYSIMVQLELIIHNVLVKDMAAKAKAEKLRNKLRVSRLL